MCCREDFVFMCKQLNLEDSAMEIRHELGVANNTRISFADFLRCRARVMATAQEGQAVWGEDTGMESDTSGVHTHHPNITSWPTMSSDSLGKLTMYRVFVILRKIYYLQ